MRRTRLVSATVIITFAIVLAASVPSRTQGVLAPLPTTVAAPADNPTTAEKVSLGRLLFWDPLLSGQKDVSCATCHHPDFGYAENLDLSIGANGVGLGAARTFAPGSPVRPVKRNSQTVLNSAFNGIDNAGHHTPAEAPMFWDVRVKSLEAQALEPMRALEEMRGDAYSAESAISTVVSRLAANGEYRRLFAQAFGNENAVNAQNLGRALAAFERSLVTTNAPFDRYMRGDTTAMTAQQIQGMNRFQSIGCANCHNGPMFSDFKVHVLGVPDNEKLPTSDAGVDNTYAFRTPSLRNLSYTAPYMHSGVFTSLNQVVNFYNRVNRGGGRGGGRRGGGNGAVNTNVSRDQLDPLLRQLNLRGGRQADLLAFLDALNDPGFDRTIPATVPSGLAVGGR